MTEFKIHNQICKYLLMEEKKKDKKPLEFSRITWLYVTRKSLTLMASIRLSLLISTVISPWVTEPSDGQYWQHFSCRIQRIANVPWFFSPHLSTLSWISGIRSDIQHNKCVLNAKNTVIKCFLNRNHHDEKGSGGPDSKHCFKTE